MLKFASFQTWDGEDFTEEVSWAGFVSVTDTLQLAVTDAGALTEQTIQKGATDTLLLLHSEAAALVVALSSTDTATVVAGDVGVPFSGTDPIAATDTVTPVLTESGTVFDQILAKTGTDTVTVAAAEVSAIVPVVDVPVTDLLTVLATETRAQVDTLIVGKSAVDTLQLLSNEVTGIVFVFDTKVATDTLLVGWASTTSITDVTGSPFYIDFVTWIASTGFTDHTSWGTGSATGVSAVETLVPTLVEVARVADQKATTDTVTPTLTDVGTILGIGVTPKAAVDDLTVALVEVATALAITEITAVDDLVYDLFETRSIFGSGTNIGASDAIVPNLVEAPISALLWGTDDAVTPVLGEIGSTPFNQLISKTASDTVTPVFDEQFEISAFGSADIAATDTLNLANVVDNAKSLLRFINIVSSDTILVSGIDVSALVKHEIRSAVDQLNIGFTDELNAIRAFTPPPEGELPPGWYSTEIEELAGIAEPWLTDPHLTTHPQGWFARVYWGVYDNNANLIVTDGSRNAAHAQGWTRYMIKDKRGKALIT